MKTISVNSIELCYETFGSQSDTPLILIMGLSEQMVAWPDKFCSMLAESSFYVIRFDNRDTGLSTKMEDCGVPDIFKAWESYFSGAAVEAPYTLQDMATDVNELQKALDIKKAYVCGLSLGGMIAQNVAFLFPEDILGMICIGSSTGDLTLPPPEQEVQAAMNTRPPETRADYIDHNISVMRAFSGGSSFYDAECRRKIAASAFDRCLYPIGFIRQSVAMLADGSRADRLKNIEVPTLVLQGKLDPMTQVEHGQAIAAAVQNSSYYALDNWGHGIDYPKLWGKIIDKLIMFRESNQG